MRIAVERFMGRWTGKHVSDHTHCYNPLFGPGMIHKALTLVLCPTSSQQGTLTPVQHLSLLTEKRSVPQSTSCLILFSIKRVCSSLEVRTPTMTTLRARRSTCRQPGDGQVEETFRGENRSQIIKTIIMIIVMIMIIIIVVINDNNCSNC